MLKHGIISVVTGAMIVSGASILASNSKMTKDLSSNEEVINSSSKEENYLPLIAYYDEHKTEFDLIKKVGSSFVLDKNGMLTLNDSIDRITNQYNLTDEETTYILNLINTQNEYAKNGYATMDENSTTLDGKVSIYDGEICITYGDLVKIFGTVAAVTPGLVVATLTAAASAVPGAGTVIGFFVGALGSGAVVGVVTAAMLNKEGIALRAWWPPYHYFKGKHPGNG